LGSGSGSVTSRAAPRIWFVSRAVMRAGWSMMAPRAMLAMYVPRGLLAWRRENSAVERRWVVYFLGGCELGFARYGGVYV
jgi:hypothetical protein